MDDLGNLIRSALGGFLAIYGGAHQLELGILNLGDSNDIGEAIPFLMIAIAGLLAVSGGAFIVFTKKVGGILALIAGGVGLLLAVLSPILDIVWYYYDAFVISMALIVAGGSIGIANRPAK